MRRLGNREITDGVVDHHGSGPQLCSERHSTRGILRPDTCSQCKWRIIRVLNRFARILYSLNRENRPERLFLKKLHRCINADNDSRLEEIWSEIGACVATIEYFCPARNGIANQIRHTLHVLRANKRANVGGWIGTNTEA